jgi:hypothetical protein
VEVVVVDSALPSQGLPLLSLLELSVPNELLSLLLSKGYNISTNTSNSILHQNQIQVKQH